MPDTLLAYMLFAAVAAFTPGPNNLMLSASGANFGYRRSLPHVLGVTIGFPVLLVAIGLGFGQLFTEYPLLHTTLKYLGAAYLLFLAWQIVSATPPETDEGNDAVGGRPLTFLQAALFQWVNPKAWTVCLGAIAAYTTLDGYGRQLAMMAIIALIIAVLSSTSWALFGEAIGRLLSTPRQYRLFNGVMGTLLVLSVLPILVM